MITEGAAVPETYLLVECMSTGEQWIQPIHGRKTLNIKLRIKEWILNEFCGEAELDGKLDLRLSGEYCAKIITDSRPIDSIICSGSAGFYLKTTYP